MVYIPDPLGYPLSTPPKFHIRVDELKVATAVYPLRHVEVFPKT